MLRVMLDFPSPMYASCGTTGEKSAPGFAVPDSVHQVKFVSPRTLPLRRTVTSANGSPAGTSIVSAAISNLGGPQGTAAGGDVTGGVTALGAGAAATRGGGEAAGGEAAGDEAAGDEAAGDEAAGCEAAGGDVAAGDVS